MNITKVVYPFLVVISLVSLSALSFLFASCGGKDPAPSVGDKAISNLVTSPWKIVSVTIDGVDNTSLFTGFTITFTKATSNAGSYTAVNGGLVWPTSGQWTIVDMNTAGSFLRNDGIEVQLLEVTATSLKMSLIWGKNTFGPGRIGSVSGQHIFTMGK